jgi:pSer/pThr/pTyr-binding forkhead associated (FHA) protein
MSQDDELETGIFRVRSEAKAEVTSKAGVVEAVSQRAPASPTAQAPSTESHSAPVDAAPTSPANAQPRLEVGGQAYPLVRAITLLGRGTEADIRVEDPGVSRRHCEIVVGNPALARDLKSTNGTLVNGERIDEVALEDGAVVKIGGTSLVYRSG